MNLSTPAVALALLAVAVLLVPLFKRLGLGSVLGYLVAGVLIGPYALKVVNDAEAVLHIAELGVTLLMFLIGLELQPARLWALRAQVFGLGALQVGSITLFASVICLLLGFTLPTSALVGFAIAMSSTAYILPLLAERKELTTRYGRESFAILLFQDVSVIPVLALLAVLVPASATGGHSAAPGWPALVALVVVAAAGRPVLRTMFHYVARSGGKDGKSAGTGSRELFSAAALLAAVGIALLMSAVGLSASLGAFLAGVLLADSEFRHELEASIEPFESLLLGLFFMAVGMGIDLSLVLSKPLIVLGLGLGILLLKLSVLYVGRRLVGEKDAVARPLAFILATGGEFAFVLFGIGQQNGLLNDSQAALLTVGVALSMAFAPFALMLNDKVIKPRVEAREPPPFDTIDDPGTPVVIAGFGRVGQIVGRLLATRRIAFTAIDVSPENVDSVRKFGNKIYYGDASKLDLLRAAKLHDAKLFVLAVDEVEASVKIAELVREQFPTVKIIARARNRAHMMRLRDLGVTLVERETFWSSIEMGKVALRELEQAQDLEGLVALFVKHDLELIDRQQSVYTDPKALIETSKQARAELESILEGDAAQVRKVL
jgi:glutathione-regulated potassium-efflux system ancillary protein KefC